METCNLEKPKIKRRMSLDQYVQGYVDAHRKDMENKNGLLSFSIYDKFFDARKQKLFGIEEHPFADCNLKVLNKELAKQANEKFKIDYYELNLHKNTRTKMHNAYCSLIENSDLIRQFADSDNTKVMLVEKEEPDLESALQKAGIIPVLDGTMMLGNAFENYGIICKTNNTNKLMPLRYLEVPSKPFFDWLYSIEGLEMVENDSADFHYYLGEADNPKKTLRRFTTELLLSLQAGCDKRI
jgi:hypothetical protein